MNTSAPICISSFIG